MIISETTLPGVFVIEPQPVADSRGHFARLFCADTFAEHGLTYRFDQISTSRNTKAGVVRGLHLQRPPHAEAKLVRVTEGVIFDVAVDVRAGSPTFGQWFGTELGAENNRQLYIPEGFAHGFQTLTATAEVAYHISIPYAPDHVDGIRWNDPDLAIRWPDPETATLSDRDAGLSLLATFEPVRVP